MLFSKKLIIAGLILGLASFEAIALAQQPQTNSPATGVQQQPRDGMRRRAMRRRARMGKLRGLRQLDLTDQQRQQARAIIQINRKNTEAQRQELRQLTQQWRAGTLTPAGMERAKVLRAQLVESRNGVRTQLNGILTVEQKAKFEEMKKTRRADHGPFGRRNQTPN